MNFPLGSVIAIGFGVLIATIGTILLLIAAFRQSLIWGVVVLLGGGLGSIIYSCLHWAEAKTGFLASMTGTVICMGGIFTIPEVQVRLWQMKNPLAAAATPAPVKAPADLNAQILEHRQHLEALQAAFAQDGADLTKQYQSLDAQRKALKPADTAAIAKFNEAAAYQTRNVQRKQMQQEIEAAQKEYEALLAARARAQAAPPVNARKVVMYTTSHCPACKAAKLYLAQKGVPFEEINVEASRDGAQAFQQLGGRGVPLILVGDKKMEGFSPQALDALL